MHGTGFMRQGCEWVPSTCHGPLLRQTPVGGRGCAVQELVNGVEARARPRPLCIDTQEDGDHYLTNSCKHLQARIPLHSSYT
jgi:hypothetical protein